MTSGGRMPRRRLLLVEDDEGVRFGIRSYFTSQGYEVIEATSMKAAIAAFEVSAPEAAIIDFQLPDGNAIDFLPTFKQLGRDVPIILLTGHGSIDRAVRAMQAGANHFLTKPVELAVLASVIERELETRRVMRRDAAGRISNERHRLDPFVGRSALIRELECEAWRVLESETPVLILGATGTGKGVLASWLHANGPRAREPFVDINCASLSRDFLETELFGHRKGAFTGALGDKPGLLEVADGGSVFLDEIGDMDLAVQPKLLKVVEEGHFRRFGDVQDRSVDVRVICATHHDLHRLMEDERFREDLYYRISTYALQVPALRDRREDIPLLAPRVAEDLAHETGHGSVEITPDAIEAFLDYDWPGNLRELRNVIERALIVAGGPRITREDLRFGPGPRAPRDDARSRGAIASDEPAPPPLDMKLDDVERQHVLRVFEAAGRRVQEAAQRLGVPRSTLYQKLRDYGVPLRGSGGENSPEK